jgi:hypothetical protein
VSFIFSPLVSGALPNVVLESACVLIPNGSRVSDFLRLSLGWLIDLNEHRDVLLSLETLSNAGASRR